MKIQPEFNIAAILSKMSVADLSDNPGREEMPPFASLFEAALQDIDDPQIAATIATLNESGMIMPDSLAKGEAGKPGIPTSETNQQAAENMTQPEFRTVQLSNGRSVITSPVADTDLQKFVSTTDFFSSSADSKPLFPEQNVLSLTDRLPPVRSAAEAISLRDGQYPGAAGGSRLATNPARAELMSMLNHESVVDRAGLRAIQAAATENPALASTPLSDASKASTAQASMTASLAAGLSAADPAAISQKPASSTPMSPPLITTDMKSGMTSGKNGLGKQQPDGEFEIADSSDDLTLRSSIMRDTAAVMMRESNITANLAEVSPRPASMATPGSMAAPAEISVLSSSAPAPLATAPTAPLADPSQPTARVAERWMHIDDLGKQFNTMVKRAFLDNSVNGLSSLRIMLYPENMGSIQAEIIDRNQTITVNLIVQSEEVARLLRDNSQSLRDALGNNNLMELNIQKDKSGNDGQMNRDGSETHGNTQARSNDAADNAVAQADTAGASSTSPNALDTYV